MSMQGTQVRRLLAYSFATSPIGRAIDHEISISPTDLAEKIRASKPEDDVCLRPVLAERPTQRSRQEQEVLLSQSQTHVRGGLGGSGGGGVYVLDEETDSLFASGGPKTPGWCS